MDENTTYNKDAFQVDFKPRFSSLQKKTLVSALGVFVLMMGLATGTVLVQNQQSIRSEAASGCMNVNLGTPDEGCWCSDGGWQHHGLCNGTEESGGGNTGGSTGGSTGTTDPNAWTCNQHTADQNTKNLFNGTWCNGKSRWLWEAAGKTASCGGSASTLKSSGCSGTQTGGGDPYDSSDPNTGGGTPEGGSPADGDPCTYSTFVRRCEGNTLISCYSGVVHRSDCTASYQPGPCKQYSTSAVCGIYPTGDWTCNGETATQAEKDNYAKFWCFAEARWKWEAGQKLGANCGGEESRKVGVHCQVDQNAHWLTKDCEGSDDKGITCSPGNRLYIGSCIVGSTTCGQSKCVADDSCVNETESNENSQSACEATYGYNCKTACFSGGTNTSSNEIQVDVACNTGICCGPDIQPGNQSPSNSGEEYDLLVSCYFKDTNDSCWYSDYNDDGIVNALDYVLFFEDAQNYQ